jgi:predicted transposase/invertase (TIGR01784 family)
LQVLEYWCIFAEKFEWLMKYLDPKADLTFYKVFGEHPDLMKSLLNALLPFKSEEEEITSVVYLTLGIMPKTPLQKYRVLAVRCEDAKGGQFIVEIQIIWSKEFMQRVFFIDSKAYVNYPSLSEDYSLLKPVYSLNLVNVVFEPELDDYYHYYHLVHEEHTDKVIDGLHLVFVELPKFTPHTFTEKKMQVLWLRYLTEIDEKTKTVPAELLANPEIAKAVSEIEESAYTEEELLGYDEFWDLVSVEGIHLLVKNTKNWSNSELKKLCKITAYDARGGEEDGSGTTPGGGSDGGGSGNTQGGGTTGGTGSEGSGGTGSEGSGGNTSQGGGTGDGTGSNGDNEHITL